MNKPNFKKIFKDKKGFTIVESLVAIFILLISVTGPMYFSQSSLRASFVSRDQIAAFFLAQDAIEYIKNVRDNTALEILDSGGSIDPDTWLSEIDAFCFVESNPNGCSIDTLSEDFFNYSGSPLEIDTDGFLRTSGISDSIFTRNIQIEKISADEAEITVTVKWTTREAIGEKSVIVKENIFNWAAGR